MLTLSEIFEQLDSECLQRKELAMRDYLQGLKDARKGIYNYNYFFHTRSDEGIAYLSGWHSKN